MEAGKETYISLRYMKDKYQNLKLSLDSSEADWKKAIDIFNDRLGGRFIEPIKELLAKDEYTYVFAVMAIECLLIETLYQFKEGIDETENNADSYSKFLSNILKDSSISYEVRKRFYREIRCGILHSGQTKKDSSLNCDKDNVITLTSGRMSINVKKFLYLIEKYFENYKMSLLDENNDVLRTNFIKKMNFICNKRY